MIFVKDINELRFIRFNKAGEELLGFSRKELMGKNDYDFFPKDQADFFTEKDRDVIRDGILKDIPEEPINTLNKGLRFLHTKKIPIYNINGKPEYLLGISEDITDMKNMYTELNRKTQELLRSNTELEQFAYIASHDLQEPLRMITSYLQLLETKYKKELDEKAKQYINFAVDGSVRMKNLINSLLSYSQVGRGNLSFEEVDLNQVLKDVQMNLEKSIEENQAVIHIENLPSLTGIRSQMVQLFQNLLNNALKFKSNEKPEIWISATKRNGGYEFSVRDNGIGIDPTYTEKIFLIFQRLHSISEYPGTGIGLAICKKIGERHYGQIWIISELNKGADFRFTLNT
jgi:PAS domain S-box-containing protein